MRAFGILLLVAAVACGIGALTQTQETELERLSRDLAGSAENAARYSKATGELIQLQGQVLSSSDTRAEASFRESASWATAKADRYKSERHHAMLLWVAGAAACLIAGIVCISSARKPGAIQAETAQVQMGDSRKCLHCAELIKVEAKVCRFCGRDVAGPEVAES
jgi:hypothetical protein